MDHIAGTVINTAVKGLTRQKRYAGLPNTIEGLKNHIFNTVIWPNLTDENNGAGVISYVRLVEGGSPAAGEGDSKGYVEIIPGLGVKALSISHGMLGQLIIFSPCPEISRSLGDSSCQFYGP